MATKIMMPKLSDTMEEGVILKWLRKEGEKIKQGEILAEIESDKADMELEAYDSGVVRKIVVPEGGKAPIGGLIAIIGDPDEDISSLLSGTPAPTQTKAVEKPAQTAGPGKPAEQPIAGPEADGKTKASPLARRLAGENKIDLSKVNGSGPQGRIIKRDLESALAGKSTAAAFSSKSIVPGTAEIVELSLIRKTIAKRMADSKTTAPHFYETVEVDMDPAITFRDQINNVTELKLSFTDIVVKATAVALMKHPQVNATYLGDKMRQYHYAHIGVAVALEEGLVTPILRNCEQKRLEQINAELRDLAERARTRKLKPEEYTGATFTISNLGMFGIEQFAAIVNPPEGAILAVGTIVEKPVVKSGQIVIGHTMKVTLSSDHRIIDGAVAARFLQDLKKILENPASLVV
ncbi:MAG: pyruvate dehydrogenase component (dihydrolipoamide acetyltransferase) [Bacteroidetes bacterium]|nr:pyruvate dehydrogenase component (dihydrolipoamide acetyltransferase) [Bacteroidota bacterium]